MDVKKDKTIITVGKEVILNMSSMPEFKSVVAEVEGDNFWIGLPRMDGQVLMMQIGQKLKICVPTKEGYFIGVTEINEIGENYNKFYRLANPTEFSGKQLRRYPRAQIKTDVLFCVEILDSKLKAKTVITDFSSGGIMVYMVPTLKEIMNCTNEFEATFTVDGFNFKLLARKVWEKSFDYIPFAGLEFVKVDPNKRSILDALVKKYLGEDSPG